jgi:hypothetical protein
MFRSKVLSLSFILITLVSACARRQTVDQAPELNLDLAVIPSPPSTGPTLLQIQITDPDGEPPGNFNLSIRGDMSHAGMEPVIVEDARGEAGIYAIPFEWTMAGDWFVTITATLPDGRTLMRTLPVQVEP